MDRWAERSLEGFGIYNQDEEKQFSSERQVLRIHLQGGFLLYSSNWTYVFSCAFLFFLFGKHAESTATCRVSGSGHDSLEKGGNFRNSHWLFKQLPAVQLQERNKKHRGWNQKATPELRTLGLHGRWNLGSFLASLEGSFFFEFLGHMWCPCPIMNSQLYLPIAGMFFAVSAYLTMYDPGKISSHPFFWMM